MNVKTLPTQRKGLLLPKRLFEDLRVASYLTELPPKEVLERKLHDVITRSRVRFENEKKMLKKKRKK